MPTEERLNKAAEEFQKLQKKYDELEVKYIHLEDKFEGLHSKFDNVLEAAKKIRERNIDIYDWYLQRLMKETDGI